MRLDAAHILVVDDEPMLRLTFQVVLQQTGAKVVVAKDGVEALAIVERQRVDLILTDLHMPNLDGIGMLRALHAAGRQIPSVLFLSSFTGEETADDLPSLGVVKTLQKPIGPADLTQLLRDLLQPSA